MELFRKFFASNKSIEVFFDINLLFFNLLFSDDFFFRSFLFSNYFLLFSGFSSFFFSNYFIGSYFVLGNNFLVVF